MMTTGLEQNQISFHLILSLNPCVSHALSFEDFQPFMAREMSPNPPHPYIFPTHRHWLTSLTAIPQVDAFISDLHQTKQIVLESVVAPPVN